MGTRTEALQVGFQILVHVEINDFAARHHEGGDLPVVEAENVTYHLVLVMLDNSGIGSFLQHHVQLFLGHRLASRILDAKEPQGELGRAGQKHHERFRHGCQHHHRARSYAGQRLRVDLGQTLGDQFAHHDGKIGNRDDHQAGGGVPRSRRRHAQRLQPFAKRFCQGGFADNPVEDADRRDPDLNGRQERVRVVTQLQGRARSLVARISQFG